MPELNLTSLTIDEVLPLLRGTLDAGLKDTGRPITENELRMIFHYFAEWPDSMTLQMQDQETERLIREFFNE